MKKLAALIAVMVGVTAVTITASVSGWGIPRPVKKPMSIREGSAKLKGGSGHYRTRYFVGGGLRRGK